MKYYYGIDLGGTNIKYGLFSRDIELIDSFTCSTPKENQNQSVLNKIKEDVVQNIKKRKISLKDIIGIGIAVPGPVKKGIGINFPNLDFIKNKDVKKELSKLFDDTIKISVGNDASLAAFAEYKRMDSNVENIVFYTVGTGIGGGIIVNDRLIEGARGIASELGHIQMENDYPYECGCGKRGCLEQLSASKGMISYYKELMKKDNISFDNEIITPKYIFDLAKKGDKNAITVVDRTAYYIALSAVNIAVILDPDMFIIGGGVSKAGDFLIDKIDYYYRRHARFTTDEIPFVLAKLGNDAGMYGAAYLARSENKNDERRETEKNN